MRLFLWFSNTVRRCTLACGPNYLLFGLLFGWTKGSNSRSNFVHADFGHTFWNYCFIWSWTFGMVVKKDWNVNILWSQKNETKYKRVFTKKKSLVSLKCPNVWKILKMSHLTFFFRLFIVISNLTKMSHLNFPSI